MSLVSEHVKQSGLDCAEKSLPRIEYSSQIGAEAQQKGQAMMLGLVLCGAGVLAWILMLELGQRVHDKSSLHRATDAAAYSAALVQARALNLHAYLNRAQLAHQLGMAHLIAVATASQYRVTLANQAVRRNPPASLIGAFFGLQHAAAYTAALRHPNETQGQQAFREAFLRHERHIHQVLDRVRQIQIREAEHQRLEAIHRMLISNVGYSGAALKGSSLRQLGLNVSVTLDETKDQIDQYSGNDTEWRDFLTHVVGQYEFLTERNRTQRNVWMINPRCPFKRHELRRKGHLRLSRDGHWTSEDSLSFHALRYNKIIGCYHREYPMGWAMLATHTELDPQQSVPNAVELPDFSRQVFWKWSRAQAKGGWNIFNGRHNPLAQRYGQSASIKWGSKGLGRYAQLKKGRERQSVRLAIKVSQQLNARDTIQSHATAQTYFLPPESFGHQKKIPSLFEPYWRATLVPNSSHE